MVAVSLADSAEGFIPEGMGPERFAASIGAAAGSLHLGLVHVADTNLVTELLGSGSNTLVFGAFGVAGAALGADLLDIVDLSDD